MSESNDRPMLTPEQWKAMDSDSVAQYHGMGNFLEWILTQDLDTSGGCLTYGNYREWYLKSFSPLGRALQ